MLARQAIGTERIGCSLVRLMNQILPPVLHLKLLQSTIYPSEAPFLLYPTRLAYDQGLQDLKCSK